MKSPPSKDAIIDGKADIVGGTRNSSLKSVSENPPMPKKRKLSSSNCRTFVAKSISEQVSSPPSSTMDPCKLPETEFHFFDVDKAEDKFQAGQIWAMYCELDGFPKEYARITKVESLPQLKVKIKWLDARTPLEKGYLQWLDNQMPISCGVFSSGDETEFNDTASFSHLFEGAADIEGQKYEIYPSRGEVWAIYRNFSFEWSSSDLQTCQYDIGEVIKADGTMKVLILEKVSDYQTVFKMRRISGRDSVVVVEIPRHELHRFSHQIPAIQLIHEKQGTLRGCWELDPKATPDCLFNSVSSTFPKETSFADQAGAKETGSDGVGTNFNIPAEQSPQGPSHLAQCSKFCDPIKRKNFEKENNMVGRRQCVGGNSSTELADVYMENMSEETSGRPLCKRKANTVSVGKKSCDRPTFGSEDIAKEMSPDGVNTTPVSVDEETPSPPSPHEIVEKRDTEFCNFDNERSCDKFKTGQVWALYCKLDEMPKNYVEIESVEFYPLFKLAVKWLMPCNPPRGVIPWVDKGMPVCCGIFKVASGEGVVFNDTVSFSHQLSEVAAVNNLYTIYPRVGEVWALHSKFFPDLASSDLKNCDCYMVEVLEVVEFRWIIVSVLQSVTSVKTVFNAVEKEGLESFALAIPWIELYRFSHQVTAFKLTEARYGKLRGCWELDPRSMPVSLYSTN